METAQEVAKALQVYEQFYNAEAYHLSQSKELGYISLEAAQLLSSKQIANFVSKGVVKIVGKSIKLAKNLTGVDRRLAKAARKVEKGLDDPKAAANLEKGVGAAKVVSKGKQETNLVNQTGEAILKNGYYEVNEFKFSEYYYNRLWNSKRGAPSLVAKEVLKGGARTAVPDSFMQGFNKYVYEGWEMIYNPTTKEVWHLQPIKK